MLTHASLCSHMNMYVSARHRSLAEEGGAGFRLAEAQSFQAPPRGALWSGVSWMACDFAQTVEFFRESLGTPSPETPDWGQWSPWGNPESQPELLVQAAQGLPYASISAYSLPPWQPPRQTYSTCLAMGSIQHRVMK